MFIEDIAQENVKLLNVPDIYLLVIIKKNFKLIDYFGPNRDGISIIMTNEKYRIEILEWSVRIFTNSLFKKEIFYNFDYFTIMMTTTTPAWFEESQQRALAEYDALAMPSRKDETWRFGNMKHQQEHLR